jgi:hypothetical protein
MAEPRRREISSEALINLRRRLDALPPRHPDRAAMLASTAALYGVSRATLYRALRLHLRPKAVRRADRCGEQVHRDRIFRIGVVAEAAD